MHTEENYTPKEMVFKVETNAVPKSLGNFESEEEARLFMEENLLAAHTRHIAERYMDQVEINIRRDGYIETLEDMLPKLRETYGQRRRELEAAEQHMKEAEAALNSGLDKVQQMAGEVNTGVVPVELDVANTWKLIYKDKKYFYTYINEEIKLVGVQDVSNYEINDLTANSRKNEAFFEKHEQAIHG